jgi:hypothetical protein
VGLEIEDLSAYRGSNVRKFTRAHVLVAEVHGEAGLTVRQRADQHEIPAVREFQYLSG